MKLIFYVLMLMIPATSYAAGAWDQVETCDDLGKIEREVALSVLKSQKPYRCCDETILECMSKEPVCPLVFRLVRDICRRAAAGRSKANIAVALARRAESAEGPSVNIDISEMTPAGDPKAKIEIVAYLCARCPLCAAFSLDLYKSVTSGPLKGIAKFYVRPHVLPNHRGSTAGALAMLAAQELGKFWEMFLYMSEHFNDFDSKKLPDWAALNGMDAERFRVLMEDSNVRQKLIESQKEGLRNQINVTPTFFINRKMYSADLNPKALEDFIEGEYETLP